VECLLLGCISGFLLPFGMEFGTNFLFMQFWTPHWNREDTLIFSFLGLICAPFGLFGGWVFWRFGIRPATAPTRELAPVFD
jgi:H+/Cl- antiporter ClcA